MDNRYKVNLIVNELEESPWKVEVDLAFYFLSEGYYWDFLQRKFSVSRLKIRRGSTKLSEEEIEHYKYSTLTGLTLKILNNKEFILIFNDSTELIGGITPETLRKYNVEKLSDLFRVGERWFLGENGIYRVHFTHFDNNSTNKKRKIQYFSCFITNVIYDTNI
ncbi:hypothetical protein NSQ43_05795 [Sporosarcina sp. FSL W8-0480]|uniref:hypothetical protein n=1 Tax=Sporosarcina sp. FSL W8-0480 TaxID=2954701 RepID=UPI0030DA4EC5